MGAFDSIRTLDNPPFSVGALPVPTRENIAVALHPSDLQMTRAMCEFLGMDHNEFYGLVVHLGAQALLESRGLKIGPDGHVMRLYAWHP